MISAVTLVKVVEEAIKIQQAEVKSLTLLWDKDRNGTLAFCPCESFASFLPLNEIEKFRIVSYNKILRRVTSRLSFIPSVD